MTVTGIGTVAGMAFELDPGDRSAGVLRGGGAAPGQRGVRAPRCSFSDDSDHEALLAELRERFPLTVLAARVPYAVRADAGRVACAPGGAGGGRGGASGVGGGRQRGPGVCSAAPTARAGGRQGPRAAARGGPAGAVTWQAVAWAAAALLGGLPLGLLLGSVGWRAVLQSLGLDSPFTVPALGDRGRRARRAAAPRRADVVAGPPGGRHGSRCHTAVGVTGVSDARNPRASTPWLGCCHPGGAGPGSLECSTCGWHF